MGCITTVIPLEAEGVGVVLKTDAGYGEKVAMGPVFGVWGVPWCPPCGSPPANGDDDVILCPALKVTGELGLAGSAGCFPLPVLEGLFCPRLCCACGAGAWATGVGEVGLELDGNMCW